MMEVASSGLVTYQSKIGTWLVDPVLGSVGVLVGRGTLQRMALGNVGTRRI